MTVSDYNWYSQKKKNNYNWQDIQKDYGTWVKNNNKMEYHPFPSLPTNEEMKADIEARTNEMGFLEDILEWLGQMAPRKVRTFLKTLCPSKVHGNICYDDFCEAVYKLGFRASEVIERRMILGPANKWVQSYFEDFGHAK